MEESFHGFSSSRGASRSGWTTRAPGQGTGLGLATCYGVIGQARGDIAVMEGARGATFEILLPRASPEAVAALIERIRRELSG